MEYREVKLRIEMEVADAASRADGLAAPQPSNPGGPSLPGQPAPDAGAGSGRGEAPPGAAASPGTVVEPGGDRGAPRGPRGGRERSEVEQAADVLEGRVAARIEHDVERKILARLGDAGVIGRTALGYAGAASGGSLSSRLIGAVPFGGLATTAAEYGPAIAAGIGEAIPGGKILDPIRQAAEGAARGLATGRSYLDAAGSAFDSTRELAFGEARLTGRVNPEFLGKYAMARYSVERQLLEAEQFRRIYGMEKMGGAAGAVVQDVVERLKAGLGLSVGR